VARVKARATINDRMKVERPNLPERAPIVPKESLLDRIFGWCIEQIAKLIWRVFAKPVLMAAFSPLLLVLGLAKVKYPNGANRRSVDDEATNPAGQADGDNAAGKATRDSVTLSGHRPPSEGAT
jgi:hypothetical protein